MANGWMAGWLDGWLAGWRSVVKGKETYKEKETGKIDIEVTPRRKIGTQRQRKRTKCWYLDR